MAKITPLITIACFLSRVLFSQTNYWRQEYGAVSTLTGGASVASVRDNGAIYYNPGALGMIDSSSISANTDVYGFDYYNLKNDAGRNLDMKSFKPDIFPQIVAGSLIIKKLPALRISYGTLTRFTNGYKFDVDCKNYYSIVPNSAGEEYYTGKAEYELSSIEQWAGVGLGCKINKILSLGMSAFGSYLDYEAHASTSVTADALLDTVPYSASLNEYNGSELEQLNAILKFGAACDLGKLKLGATVSVRGIKLWSSGRIDKSLEGYNLNYNNPDTSNLFFRHSSFVIDDAADNLKANYFQPTSFSAGASYYMGRWVFHCTSELVLGKKNYVLMSSPVVEQIQPIAGYQNDTVSNFLSVKTNIRPVFNLGLGFEYQWLQNISILGGLRTDFSNEEQFLPNNDELSIQSFIIPSWDYIHFSLGGSYKKGTQLVTAGINYGVGIAVSAYQAVNLAEPVLSHFLRGMPEKDTGTSVHYLTFVLGYTYYFKK